MFIDFNGKHPMALGADTRHSCSAYDKETRDKKEKDENRHDGRVYGAADARRAAHRVCVWLA